MSKFTDQQYLKNDQYKDAGNLTARATIHDRFSTNPYGWFNWVFDALKKLPPNVRILEVGSGSGLLWKSIGDRIPTGWDIALSDLSAGMLDSAWRNLVVLGRAFQFKDIDIQSIPFLDETFDAVIANHMLYHVPDRAKAFAEIKRVLKPGGHFFAATNGEMHMRGLADWFRRIQSNHVWDKPIAGFMLENGAEQLEPFFRSVTLSRYEDSLQVTELEPLLDYIRSMMRADELSEQEFAQVQAELEKELKEKGRIFIEKDSGMFETVK